MFSNTTKLILQFSADTGYPTDLTQITQIKSLIFSPLSPNSQMSVGGTESSNPLIVSSFWWQPFLRLSRSLSVSCFTTMYSDVLQRGSLWRVKDTPVSQGISRILGDLPETGQRPDISFIMCVCSVVSDSVTLWTVAHQAPLSMGFPRQEYWSRLPFPTPGDLPDPGIEPTSLVSSALAGGYFTTVPPGKPFIILQYYFLFL